MLDENIRERSLINEGLATWLNRYGELMTKEEAACLLRFKSPTALRMARRRGSINLTAVKLPGRKQDFYRTSDVMTLLSSWLGSAEENTM